MTRPVEVELVGGPMDGAVMMIEEPEAPVLRFPAGGRMPTPAEMAASPRQPMTSRVYEYWATRARSRHGRPVFRWGGEAEEIASNKE